MTASDLPTPFEKKTKKIIIVPVILANKFRASGAHKGLYYSDAVFFLLKGAGLYYRNFDPKSFAPAALNFFSFCWEYDNIKNTPCNIWKIGQLPLVDYVNKVISTLSP